MKKFKSRFGIVSWSVWSPSDYIIYHRTRYNYEWLIDVDGLTRGISFCTDNLFYETI